MPNFTEHIPPPCTEEVEILHADRDIVVAVKPSGLLSVPGRYLKDCMLHRMMYEFGDIHMVHRLDLDTSGVMVMARSKAAAQSLHKQFREREVDKEYVAIVWGEVQAKSGVLDFPLEPDPVNRPRHRVSENGREAITHYEGEGTVDGNTRLRLKPVTGRSHQLRVHTSHIGHPILGCDLYAHPEALNASERLMLHAETLGFSHPSTGERQAFHSKSPF